MRIQEIYFQDMELALKIKCLTPDEVETIKSRYSSLSKIEYFFLVLETCVYNLRSEVSIALSAMTKNASDKEAGDQLLKEIYNGCVMLNPGLDINTWVRLTQSYDFLSETANPDLGPTFIFPGVIEPSRIIFDDDDDDDYMPVPRKQPKPKVSTKITKSKFLNLKKYLTEKVIGQEEAIEEIYRSLKRSQVGLKDPERPVGVFLFAGPSGVGKTLIAKELHKYLYGNKSEFVRIDCGEYQQKHENQKLIGSAAGYVGYEDGGQLTDAIRENPHTVLLLDEVEKAHPDLWGTFLNVFDDGYLIDNKGNSVSFKDVIIIMTSNLGNDKIVQDSFTRGTGFASSIENEFSSRRIPKREVVESRTQEEIRKYFKPELLNRLDNTIIFNYLEESDYRKIAELELASVAEKMSKMHFNLHWSSEAIDLLVDLSGMSLEGARSMAKIRRSKIEDELADTLLQTKYRRGTTFNIDVKDDVFNIVSSTKSIEGKK